MKLASIKEFIGRYSKIIWKWIKWPTVILVFISPVLFYYLAFHDYPISRNPEDWASFGGYIGGIYSVFVTILVIFLSRLLEKSDDKQKNKALIAKELFEQINKIYHSNNQLSINKFVKDIERGELFLPDGLIRMLKNLLDSFQSAHDSNGTVDMELKKNVLQRLKDVYNE